MKLQKIKKQTKKENTKTFCYSKLHSKILNENSLWNYFYSCNSMVLCEMGGKEIVKTLLLATTNERILEHHSLLQVNFSPSPNWTWLRCPGAKSWFKFNYWSLNVCCPLKGYTCLNKPGAKSCRVFLSMYELIVYTRLINSTVRK